MMIDGDGDDDSMVMKMRFLRAAAKWLLNDVDGVVVKAERQGEFYVFEKIFFCHQLYFV